jgi:hypothetical protein
MNFCKLDFAFDPEPLMAQLSAQPELWDRDPERLNVCGPHRETHDIWIRYKDKAENVASGDWRNFSDEHTGIWYPAYYALPACKPLIFDLMRHVHGERLGGVLLYSVPAGKRIHPHIDTGWHVEFYDKFNLYLRSDESARFRYADGSFIPAKTGDCYWFRNDIEHDVVNDGSADQIVLTVCIKTEEPCPSVG